MEITTTIKPQQIMQYTIGGNLYSQCYWLLFPFIDSGLSQKCVFHIFKIKMQMTKAPWRGLCDVGIWIIKLYLFEQGNTLRPELCAVDWGLSRRVSYGSGAAESYTHNPFLAGDGFRI